MNFQLLSELKTRVSHGELGIETALDLLYQAGLKEIGRVYDQAVAVPHTPGLPPDPTE